MRLGVLDVGSNTVHLLVVDAHPGARPIPEASHKSVLRLMRYLEPDGAISDEGVAAILAAVGEAAEAAQDAGIDELLPFATSAIREAANGEEVLARVARETGVELQVLSGDDEARLTFLAVRRWYGWSAERILLFDIGGGSLEIAQGIDEVPDVARSLPLGAGRSTIAFLPDDPPCHRPGRARLRAHARGGARRTPIGASATCRRPTTSWARRRRSGRSPDSPARTRRASARRSAACSAGRGSTTGSRASRKIPADARPALPGITADRTFQIVAGAVVLSEAMRAFDVDELEVSPWALREGLILRRLDRMS